MNHWRWVYFIGPEGEAGPIKIGCTNSPTRRLAQIQYWSPVPLVVIATFPGTPAQEHALHRRFAEDRLHGEWFRASKPLLDFIAGIPTQANEVAA